MSRNTSSGRNERASPRAARPSWAATTSWFQMTQQQRRDFRPNRIVVNDKDAGVPRLGGAAFGAWLRTGVRAVREKREVDRELAPRPVPLLAVDIAATVDLDQSSNQSQPNAKPPCGRSRVWSRLGEQVERSCEAMSVSFPAGVGDARWPDCRPGDPSAADCTRPPGSVYLAALLSRLEKHLRQPRRIAVDNSSGSSVESTRKSWLGAIMSGRAPRRAVVSTCAGPARPCGLSMRRG